MKTNSSFFNDISQNIGFVVRKYAPLLILLGLVVLFTIISPNFMTFNNIRLMFRQVSFVAIAAVGLMFVMVSGGIDLSVGAQIILTNICLAIMISEDLQYQFDPVVAIPIILALGTILGVTNGALSIILKIHPLIITLGTAMIYRGLGYIIADGRNIGGLPDSFRIYGQGYFGPVPVPVIVMVIVALIGGFVLQKTYFGRYVFAMGGNQEAARLAGLNVNRMKLTVFAICGFAAGITSVLLLSRVFNGQVTTGAGIEFDALTAALLGGVSFIGGEGSVFGLITGVLIIGVLNNGMQLFGLQDFYQLLVKGVVLLAAVGFDTYQKSHKAKETVEKVAVTSEI
jgi:ribose/xylose/arabinose/galactoside ABC-type transport system permease subunit